MRCPQNRRISCPSGTGNVWIRLREIRLFGCRWCGAAERISSEILVAKLHHRGSKMVYHTPVPPQQRILLSFENDSLFLRKFPAQSDEADHFPRIDMALHRVPLCQPLDTNSLLLKIKMNLAPCAVAVCLIPVDYTQPGFDPQIRRTDCAGGQDQLPVASESGWQPDYPCGYDGRGQKEQGCCFFRNGGDLFPSCLWCGYRVPNPMPRCYG